MDVNQKSYKTSHMGDLYGKRYDEIMYKIGLFEHEMWQEEKDILVNILAKHDLNGRLLDFACGSGRIISFLEDKFAEAFGLDISSDMLDEARDKVKKAELICGDFSRNPDLINGHFNCITAFRFFLHAEQELRNEAFRFIKNKMQPNDSKFIFNIHGNTYSTYWFKCVYDRLIKGSWPNRLSMKEVKQMLDYHGFKVIDYYGVGFIFKVFYKLMPTGLWKFIENVLGRVSFMKRFSSNLIFVCEKKNKEYD